MKKISTVDEYFAELSPDRREGLTALRSIIRQVLPKATERISYSMPAFEQDGIVVWYAAAKNHYGLYPRPKAIEEFRERLLNYKTTKGAIQFPADAKLPVTLIKDIVRFNLALNVKTARGTLKK